MLGSQQASHFPLYPQQNCFFPPFLLISAILAGMWGSRARSGRCSVHQTGARLLLLEEPSIQMGFELVICEMKSSPSASEGLFSSSGGLPAPGAAAAGRESPPADVGAQPEPTAQEPSKEAGCEASRFCLIS